MTIGSARILADLLNWFLVFYFSTGSRTISREHMNRTWIFDYRALAGSALKIIFSILSVNKQQ